MPKETKEQLELEAEIKNQAQKFITDLNATLPEVMELEYEGFYRRGFFVSKKRYAVIEDGEIIAKGLELVRRDWAPIVKQTQKDVLKDILKEGNTTKAINTVKKVLKRLKTGKIEGKELIIHTQITKPLSEYKQIGPHVVAAKKMEEHGIKITKGTIIQYVIVKGKGSISQRAVPYDYSEGADSVIRYLSKIQDASPEVYFVLGYTYASEDVYNKNGGLDDAINCLEKAQLDINRNKIVGHGYIADSLKNMINTNLDIIKAWKNE